MIQQLVTQNLEPQAASDKTLGNRNLRRHAYGLLPSEKTILENKLAQSPSQSLDLQSSLESPRGQCLDLETSLEWSKRLRAET